MGVFHTFSLIMRQGKAARRWTLRAQQIDFSLWCVIRLDKEALPQCLHVQQPQIEQH